MKLSLTAKEKEHKKLEKKLSYSFKDSSLLTLALTHTSYTNENPVGLYPDNERLEFLGDAVLDLIITRLLIDKFPEAAEGELSRLRSALVNEQRLSSMAGNFDIGKYLLLGKGEDITGGRNKDSILSAAYEAIIGAIYLDGDFTSAFQVVENHFSRLISAAYDEGFHRDYKTELQEISQSLFSSPPDYILTGEAGPDHDKSFEVGVLMNGNILGKGRGKSKKAAEQQAARETLKHLKVEISLKESVLDKNRNS
jgi:ribonuclease III